LPVLVSWRWLSQFVDTQGVDPLAFAEKFTTTVAEIDDVVQWGFGLRDVVVADVLAIAPHPNADKLRLATVDIGSRTVQVVCGAPDLRVGLRVPFVPPGVTLPSGITVRDGEVRGVPSPGMLASEKDLGLSDENAGLLSLDGCDAPAGTPLHRAIELEDVLYDVDNKAITHRPDLWGLYGVAREVAAMLDRPLQPLGTDVAITVETRPLAISLDAGPACPRYVCLRMANLLVVPAPVNARLLLRRLGTRPISNIVDATNLVMLETGNPLHAFDARFLRGNAIVVRRALDHETITTLDGQERKLQKHDCVICDGEGPVALAGIMGGANSEIREDTTEVVLEAANFDAPTIRRTAMRLGMRTESSARFEKALDPELARDAALRFAYLTQQWNPQVQFTSRLLEVEPESLPKPFNLRIPTSYSYLRERLGVSENEMPSAWIDACLTRLQFGVVEISGDAMTVVVPTFRATKDIKIAEDLIEELGRHYGYDNIRSEAPQVAARPPHTPPQKLLERQVRNTLVHAGLTEQVLYGFDDEDSRRRLGLHEAEKTRAVVRNPISAQHTHMRRNLLPNLIRVAEQGLVQGDDGQPARKGLNIGVFEIGRVFVPEKSDDRGLPPVLVSGTEAQIAAYTAGMEGEMLRGVLDARVGTKPLPLQPIRLGLVFAERLGGGAEGSKLVFPAPEVTHRLLQQLIATLTHLQKWLGKDPLVLRAPLELPASEERASPGAPDMQPSWRSKLGFDLVTPDGETIGWVAALHPRVRIELDQPAQAVMAELDLGALLRVANFKRVSA
jgi:phenylalanyl-tRNA synthetase beta chain